MKTKKMKLQSRVFIFAFIFAVVFGYSFPSIGGQNAKCRVMTIHATNKEGKTDEKLKNLSILKKPPLNSYKSFLLLSDQYYNLAPDSPVSLNLPLQIEMTGKLIFKGVNEALKELNFKLSILKSKSKEPEEINFALHGKAPFLYVRPFKEGLLLLSIQCSMATEDKPPK